MGEISYLEEATIKRVITSVQNSRDQLMILLLYELGCSLKELLNIRLRDIDLEKEQISITSTSGTSRQVRDSLISAPTKERIRNYINANNLENRKTAYLFTSSHNRQMTLRRATQILSSSLESQGLGDLSPQVIKYSHIVNAYRRNVPISLIREQVGLTKERLISILLSIDEPNVGSYKEFLEGVL
ncbi:site-specific integrase [Candidatus Woesearchaeota archaeon]|nr:site-specific integrase [Candidatus Woesearchaeota archaeon]